jgi:hypothetical protein
MPEACAAFCGPCQLEVMRETLATFEIEDPEFARDIKRFVAVSAHEKGVELYPDDPFGNWGTDQ